MYCQGNFLTTQDVSKLTRKYLPPGTVNEVHQFYCGWCSAHGITTQASHLVDVYLIVYFFLKGFIHDVHSQEKDRYNMYIYI